MKQLLLLPLALILFTSSALAADKQILLIAGARSHGAGEHEFRAGALLLAEALNRVPGYHATVASNGWPADPKALESADAVLLYADGGDGHPAIRPDRLKQLDALAARGVGIGAAHYGVEVPKGEPGDAMLRWTGGYFETFWSVNPHWTARFTTFPSHPITRGLKPFEINDEWYFHMRFVPGMKGVTPVLSAVAPAETMNRGDGPHSGNPAVRDAVKKGEPQVLMWAYDRPGGGRGFGFTGGHFHRNWSDPNVRKAVLNALVWIAGGDIPPDGVASSVTPDQLARNLDSK
ncbi:MAG: ThuA domain-containing protein [Verrucomicrobia bacterium]|nr:ThuA domain-containing protein [Verrucomicrobiota bacterium]